MPSGTWPSRRRCAGSIRTSRSTGSPSTRSRPCSRPTASGSIPASAWLASESAHIAAESTGHALNAFQAIRRMDEILIANFMVFHDVVEAGEYDLVIGDEAWDVDYYLHENPELKRTAFAWLTDFVGWLPMPAGGDREAFLTADYNAEMIEQVERFPRIRDRAIFVGDPGRHRAGHVRAEHAGHPRLDRAPLRVLRVRHGIRPDAAHRGPRRPPAASSATTTTSGSSSSRSAAPASARPCCVGSSMPIRRRAGRSPACG